jgi:hypothetical protein
MERNDRQLSGNAAQPESIARAVVAHAAFDLTAVAMIYLDHESAIAHLFFK